MEERFSMNWRVLEQFHWDSIQARRSRASVAVNELNNPGGMAERMSVEAI